ncbi:MAG: LptE family protein [Candidatus Eisenbacteria bacterium]
MHGRLSRLGALAALISLSLSCGYTASTTLPGHIKNVAIPVFRNETLEYRIEEEITSAVIDKFVADNRLTVVGEKEAASVLLGTVKQYVRRVFSYSAGEVAQEYEVTIKVAVEFKDVSKGRVIWKDDSLVSTARYFAVDMAGHEAQTEQKGRTPAIDFLAGDILTRTVEGW